MVDPPLRKQHQPNVFCSCRSDLHNSQEVFWTILSLENFKFSNTLGMCRCPTSIKQGISGLIDLDNVIAVVVWLDSSGLNSKSVFCRQKQIPHCDSNCATILVQLLSACKRGKYFSQVELKTQTGSLQKGCVLLLVCCVI